MTYTNLKINFDDLAISLETKIPFNKYLQLIYCLLLNLNYYQIKNCVAVQDEPISNARKKLRELVRAYMAQQNILMGILYWLVESDETVLRKRGTIRLPTSLDYKIQIQME
ncbi:hypothetical protein H312_01317 [Anncaliia algerae PRA339]|uniref:Uncharacterized protein n=1 Tax=Anncaliia algerae PRA339 TaxID=1288291 RepID=A0A059F224_9MICR|nr:hypothetical protein H312_01317 [Anncaliia algerae PRA339]